jgi:hypothetical protein
MASIDYTKCLPHPAADIAPNGSATFADLERIAQRNPLVNFHLKAWRQGAFLGVERMLTSLAVHLAATNEALTERAVERTREEPPRPFMARLTEESRAEIRKAMEASESKPVIDIPAGCEYGPSPFAEPVWKKVVYTAVAKTGFCIGDIVRTNLSPEHDGSVGKMGPVLFTVVGYDNFNRVAIRPVGEDHATSNKRPYYVSPVALVLASVPAPAPTEEAAKAKMREFFRTLDATGVAEHAKPAPTEEDQPHVVHGNT